MVALWTAQLPTLKGSLQPIEFEALTTGPPDALADLLVHQFLPTRLPGSPENDPLAGIKVPVRHNHCVCRAFTQDLVPVLSAGQLLCFRTLGRVVTALAASAVLAAVALARWVESVTALVTTAVYTHTNWSVDTQDMAVHLVPGMGIHVETEAFCKLLSSLVVYLCPGYAFSFEDGWNIIEFWRSAFRHTGGFAAKGSAMMPVQRRQYLGG